MAMHILVTLTLDHRLNYNETMYPTYIANCLLAKVDYIKLEEESSKF